MIRKTSLARVAVSSMGVLFIGVAAVAWRPAAACAQQPSEQETNERFEADRDRYWLEADRLYYSHQYKEAVEACQAMLDIEKRWLGPESDDVRGSMLYLATLYSAAENWEAAEEQLLDLIVLCITSLGEEAYETREAQTELAYCQQLQGLTAEERAALREGSVAEAYFLRRHWGGGLTVDERAQAVSAIGKLFADKIRILGERHRESIVSMDTYAQMLLADSNYVGAAELFARAAALANDVLGEDSFEYAGCLKGQAMVHLAQFEADEAIALMLQSLHAADLAVGKEHMLYTPLVKKLAEAYSVKGDTARAALALAEGMVIKPQRSMKYNALFEQAVDALVADYQRRGDAKFTDQLERFMLARVAGVVGQESANYAECLAIVARAYFLQVQFARAEPLLRQSLNLTKQVVGERHLNYAQRLYDFADWYKNQERYAESEGLLREALDIFRELQESYAMVQDEQQQLEQHLALESVLHNYLFSLNQRPDGVAEAYEAVLRWKGATLARTRAVRAAAASPELRPVLAEMQSITHQWAALAAVTPVGDERWNGRISELADAKRKLEIQLSAGSKDYREALKEPQLEDVQKSLPANVALVDYVALNYSRGRTVTEMRSDLAGTHTSQKWLYQDEAGLYAFVVRRDRGVQMFQLPYVGADELIDAWRGGFGATPEAQAAGQRLREALWDPVAGAVGDAKAVLISPHGSLAKLPFAALPGKAPGTYLIEDVAVALVPVPQLIPELTTRSQVDGEARRLLAIGGVDYNATDAGGAAGAAIGADAGPSSGRTGVSRGGVRARAQRALTAGMTWDFLAGTETEATEIAKLYRRLKQLPEDDKQVVLLDHGLATEEAFCDQAPACDVLHVATHGFFLDHQSGADDVQGASDGSLTADGGPKVAPSPGLLSGLVLAGANHPRPLPDDPAELEAATYDGYLTADEIASLQLGKTQLVVLPACYSALGQSAGGEGLLGIQRAFQAAGARTTIAALWAVDDKMTERLMTAFYRNALQGKQSYLDALRNAQLEILHELRAEQNSLAAANDAERGADGPQGTAPAERGSPYYWAAFTLSGDWR